MSAHPWKDKVAKAPWMSCDPGDYADYCGRCRVIIGDDLRIAVVLGDHNESKANQQLFIEAGTVLHETGLTPRELADQRDRLLAALRPFANIAEYRELREAITACLRAHEQEGMPGVWAEARAAIAACDAQQVAQIAGDMGEHDAAVWSLIGIAESCGAEKDQDDNSTWWTLDINAFYALEQRMRDAANCMRYAEAERAAPRAGLLEALIKSVRKVRNRAEQENTRAHHGEQFVAGLQCAANMIEKAIAKATEGAR